jgi:hypothetical protein
METQNTFSKNQKLLNFLLIFFVAINISARILVLVKNFKVNQTSINVAYVFGIIIMLIILKEIIKKRPQGYAFLTIWFSYSAIKRISQGNLSTDLFPLFNMIVWFIIIFFSTYIWAKIFKFTLFKK